MTKQSSGLCQVFWVLVFLANVILRLFACISLALHIEPLAHGCIRLSRRLAELVDANQS